jgi:hypothetical protein
MKLAMELIELDDLDKIAGYYITPNDPSLCECGLRRASDCRDGQLSYCPMHPEPPDDRFPSAQERWHLGY